MTVRVKEADTVLRDCFALIGSLPIPLQRLGVVLLDSKSLLVAETQSALSKGVTLFCRLAKPIHGLLDVPLFTQSEI